MEDIKKNTIEDFVIYAYIFLAPVQATVFDPIFNSAYINLSATLLVAAVLVHKLKISIAQYDKNTLALYIFPMLLSTGFVFITYFVLEFNNFYYEYITNNLPNRWLTSLTNLIVFIFILHKIKNENINKKIRNNILYAYFTVLMIIVFFGLWQLANNLFGIPIVEIKTRDYVHSVGVTDLLFDWRLTSIAREPSFFVPFVVEFLLLTLVLVKRKLLKIIYVFFGVIILLFTFAGSAVIEFFFLFLGLLSLLRYSTAKKIIYFFIAIVVVAFVSYYETIVALFIPIWERMINFSIYSNSRAFIWFHVFVFSFRDGIINAVFGHGPNSFKYLGTTETYPEGSWRAGRYIEGGANNYLADALYELGIIGFISYMIIFLRELIFFFHRRYMGMTYLTGYFLSLHLIASSIYRGDYAAPRFFVLLIILKLLRAPINNKETK